MKRSTTGLQQTLDKELEHDKWEFEFDLWLVRDEETYVKTILFCYEKRILHQVFSLDRTQIEALVNRQS